MRIERNPFWKSKTHPRISRHKLSYWFGRGEDTVSFSRDNFYKWRKNFRFGPLLVTGSYYFVYGKPEKYSDINRTTHHFKEK